MILQPRKRTAAQRAMMRGRMKLALERLQQQRGRRFVLAQLNSKRKRAWRAARAQGEPWGRAFLAGLMVRLRAHRMQTRDRSRFNRYA